jgi:hypothetical protein
VGSVTQSGGAMGNVGSVCSVRSKRAECGRDRVPQNYDGPVSAVVA